MNDDRKISTIIQLFTVQTVPKCHSIVIFLSFFLGGKRSITETSFLFVNLLRFSVCGIIGDGFIVIRFGYFKLKNSILIIFRCNYSRIWFGQIVDRYLLLFIQNQIRNSDWNRIDEFMTHSLCPLEVEPLIKQLEWLTSYHNNRMWDHSYHGSWYPLSN